MMDFVGVEGTKMGIDEKTVVKTVINTLTNFAELGYYWPLKIMTRRSSFTIVLNQVGEVGLVFKTGDVYRVWKGQYKNLCNGLLHKRENELAITVLTEIASECPLSITFADIRLAIEFASFLTVDLSENEMAELAKKIQSYNNKERSDATANLVF